MNRKGVQMKEDLVKARKQNMRLYALYRPISLDLLFYYCIEFLFLTQVKQISASHVVLGSSFYAIFMIIWQIPASVIIDKIGTKRCTVLANVFNVLYLILIMGCTGLETLILAQFFSSLCFTLKDISDIALLEYSIPETSNKGAIFSKIEGKAYKDYYLFNCISSVICGFLYAFNNYLPMIISLMISILAVVMSLGFKELGEKSEKKQSSQEKMVNYFQDLKKGMQFIFKSPRLRSLFICVGITWGIFAENHWKDIEFGIIWKMLTPYCTCKSALTKLQYVIGGLMPTLILGFGLGLVAIIIGNMLLFLLAELMIFGGGGDFLIAGKLLLFRTKYKDCIYMDHPTECGLVAFYR